MPPDTPKQSVAELKEQQKESSKITIFFEKHPMIKYLYDFIFLITVYGFLINFALNTFFNETFPITVINFLGCGVSFYFVKEEFPRIIQRSLPPRMR